MHSLKEREMHMSLREWRKAILMPSSYRSSSMFRFQNQFYASMAVILFVLMLLFYISGESGNRRSSYYGYRDLDKENGVRFSNPSEFVYSSYNSTYPLTRPVSIHDSVRYRIALVSDLDHSSASRDASNTWESYFLKGNLMWNPISMSASISWDAGGPVKLKSKYGYSGRGMELSELVTFDGRLITFDDRSGMVFSIENNTAVPWLVLIDGDGKEIKGFKGEWATVKDQKLYIGGMGKEWTTPSGEFVNKNPMWVKCINKFGEVQHLSWEHHYKALRSSVGIEFPGYMLHESAVWSDIHRRWFFLPRRMSHNVYNEELDETQGTNVLLSANENFSDVQTVRVGEVIPTHGFSSFKFIPGTKDEVIFALKTVEHLKKTETYIMIFTISGRIIQGETKVADVKYEGFDFI